MYLTCERCERGYNDEFCSTVCPHRGIGFCAVCDCILCVCEKEICSDCERSANSMIQRSKGDGGK